MLRISRNAEKTAKKKSTDESVAEGFVLYETAKREVTSLTVAADGTFMWRPLGRNSTPGTQARSTVIATAQGTTTISSAAPQVRAQGGAPFLAFPSGDFEQHLQDSERMERQRRYGIRGTMWCTRWD